MTGRFGRYEIKSEVRTGSLGDVYQAFDPVSMRSVTIKALTAAADAGALEQFRLEARSHCNLIHPSIASVYDYGEQDGVLYLVLESLEEGRSLDRLISYRNPISMLDKTRILLQIAEGLSYAHSQGVIHGDIKPANVVVLPDGSVKLMDFGIARLTARDTASVKHSGFLTGTLRYMAPEQFTDGKMDELTDIFSFGVTAYELVSGRHPFDASAERAFMFGSALGQADPLEKVAPDCPSSLTAVINRALEKERRLRYQNAGDLVWDLQATSIDLSGQPAVALVDSFKSVAHAHRDASVVIVVEDDHPVPDPLVNVQAQVIKFMEACGFLLHSEEPPEFGSWLKRLLFGSREPMTSQQIERSYHVAHAALQDVAAGENRHSDSELATVARQLIEAVKPFETVAIRMGPLQLRKSTVHNRSELVIDMVSANLAGDQIDQRERLHERQERAAADGTGPSQTHVCATNLSELECDRAAPTNSQSPLRQAVPIRIFFSYSHEDEALRDELERHLATLQREGLVSEWHDRNITAGREWVQEIDKNLHTAHLILLCVSSDFIASDYCYGLEMKCALQMHYRHEAFVIPVIFRPVDWQSTPIGRLQALPTDGKPITTWFNRDEALVDTARGIRRVVTTLGRSSQPASNQW